MISKEKLLELYRTMLRIRLVELKIEELYSEDEMKTPVHLCIGQEAVSAGVCANLNRDDHLFSNHRGHGHYLAKGGDLKAMIAELYGRKTGCAKGRGGSMHLVDISAGFEGTSSIIAGSVPIAAGAALTEKLRESRKVSVSFFGDAAVEQGVFYETASFAALKKLPVIFICENNFYSVCTPLDKRQPDDNLFNRAKAFSIPSFQVDGNNVLEVYEAANKAVNNARKDMGPTFIECKTYRWRDHAGSGADMGLGYRTQKELDSWIEKCPIEKTKAMLMEEKILTEEKNKTIDKEIQIEIDEAFEFAQNSPLPDESEIFDNLYS